jgi:hypothetical protein
MKDNRQPVYVPSPEPDPKWDSGLPRILACGLDTLEVGYSANVPRSDLDLDTLLNWRDRLRRSSDRDFESITLGTEFFSLERRGSYPYAIVLKNRSFEVRLAERLQPSCFVKFFSEALWHEGLSALLARIQQWMASVRLETTRTETVARADWAFDLELKELDFDSNSFVSRAAAYQENGLHGVAQTFRRGRGDIVVRVYDKVAEITQASGKVWMFPIWGQSTNVWRIEFQVRRPALKRYEVSSLDDLALHQGRMLQDLARKHTTIRLPTLDTNRSRWPLHPIWKALLTELSTWPDNPEQIGVCRPNSSDGLAWKRRQIYKQVYGLLRRCAALDTVCGRRPTEPGREIPSLDDAIKGMRLELIANHHNSIEWTTKLHEQILALELGR